MLCRLNHELLPDPGNPIARTTVPLLGRTGAGTASVGAFPATTGFETEASTADPSTSAETAGAGVASPGRERPPPRPPRLRRRRGVRGFASPVADATIGAEADSGSGSGSALEGRRDSTIGGATGAAGRAPGSLSSNLG